LRAGEGATKATNGFHHKRDPERAEFGLFIVVSAYFAPPREFETSY